MTHLSSIAEQMKISSEAWWATIGRAIADNARNGHSVQSLVDAAESRRALEYQNVEKLTQFAALTRQIGAAAATGGETQPIIERLMQLRRQELGPTIGGQEALRLAHEKSQA